MKERAVERKEEFKEAELVVSEWEKEGKKGKE